MILHGFGWLNFFSHLEPRRAGIAWVREIERRWADSAHLTCGGPPQKQNQDRCDHWSSLGYTGNAGTPHPRGLERRATELFARGFRQSRRADRAHPLGGGGRRPPC